MDEQSLDDELDGDAKRAATKTVDQARVGAAAYCPATQRD